MNKWTNAAKRRLVEIQAAEDGAADMRAMATALSQLPPGQLRKILTQDIIDILEKYGYTES